MQDIYFYLIVFGVILIGFALLQKGRKPKDEVADISKMLADRQNRELIQMVSELKQDVEKNLKFIGTEMEDLKQKVSQAQLQRGAGSFQSGDHDAFLLHSRYAEIFELKQQGKTAEEIAKSMDMGTGEVELILQLHSLSSKEQRKKH